LCVDKLLIGIRWSTHNTFPLLLAARIAETLMKQGLARNGMVDAS
jgi:hypothetical protein